MGHFMKFGYARVSSNTQDHAAQIEALQAAGCGRIFSEKASGKSTNGRPEFAKLMKALNYGDVVTVVKPITSSKAGGLIGNRQRRF
jgi:DNA invertase Pin-like site-specific DNA recombinase